MEPNTQHSNIITISVGVLVVMLLFGGVLALLHYNEKNNTNQAEKNNEITETDPRSFVNSKNEFTNSTRFISGIVVTPPEIKTDGELIVVSAVIVNTDVLPDAFRPEDVRYLNKNFIVFIASDTIIEGKTKEEILEGDNVRIETKESIYKGDAVTAAKLTYFDPEQERRDEFLGNQKSLDGEIMSVKTTTQGIVIDVKAHVIDREKFATVDILKNNILIPKKIASYKVEVTGSTKIRNSGGDISSNSLTKGVIVYISTEENIYDNTSLTAQTIRIE